MTKCWVWAAMSVPAIYIQLRYLSDTISYGQVIHQTGDWSIGLLVLALAVTPLRRVLPRAWITRWLLRHRRAIGVTSFIYATLHTVTYLERKWGYGYILKEGLEPGLMTGWVALAIFLTLAITSNNPSVKRLGRNWQRLHKTVYLATALTFAHWIFTALEPRSAYVVLAALCLVESLRFLKK